MIVGDAV